MKTLQELIFQITGLLPATQNKIVGSVVILLFIGLLRMIFLRIIWNKSDNPQVRYRWQKTSVYVGFILGLLLVGRVWFAGISSLTTFLGLITAGLAIALQDLVKSIAGWMFIMWRRPFVVGDRIQVGDIKGDVVDIRLFKFTLAEIGNWVDADQSTGRIIHLSNHLILTELIANYTEGFEYIWHEIPVLLTFESNWKEAKEIIKTIGEKHAASVIDEAKRYIREASKKYLIYYKYVTPIVYTTVKDSGILLTLRYMVKPRRRRGIEQAVWEDILNAFSGRKDIDLAYPTIRTYNNRLEGKPQTGGPQSG